MAVLIEGWLKVTHLQCNRDRLCCDHLPVLRLLAWVFEQSHVVGVIVPQKRCMMNPSFAGNGLCIAAKLAVIECVICKQHSQQVSTRVARHSCIDAAQHMRCYEGSAASASMLIVRVGELKRFLLLKSGFQHIQLWRICMTSAQEKSHR